MPPRGREKRENWLLIKERDEFADETDPLLRNTRPASKTGRTMEEIAEGDSGLALEQARPRQRGIGSAHAPQAKAAMRCRCRNFARRSSRRSSTSRPREADWVHEFKYDGYRLLIAAQRSDGPLLYAQRPGLDREVPGDRRSAVAAMDLAGALIDGEVVAFKPDGRTDFSTLQNALSEGGPIDFFAFDLLEEGGEDITRLPLIERKQPAAGAPRRPAEGQPHPFQHAHRRRRQERCSTEICAAGHEGIVSKKASAPLPERAHEDLAEDQMQQAAGVRHRRLAPSDKRSGFRSLLLGTWEDGKLVYAAASAPASTTRDLEELSARFKKLARKDLPFETVPRDVRRGGKWVEPKLVAEIAFTEFTSDGILRHPSFLGLREDKKAREVQAGEARAGGEGDGRRRRRDRSRRAVRITHPGRVVFPGPGAHQGATSSTITRRSPS